jgi:hypothetical protein
VNILNYTSDCHALLYFREINILKILLSKDYKFISLLVKDGVEYFYILHIEKSTEINSLRDYLRLK